MLLIPTYTSTAYPAFFNEVVIKGNWGNVSNNKVWENLSESSDKVQNHIPLKSLQSLLEGIFFGSQ